MSDDRLAGAEALGLLVDLDGRPSGLQRDDLAEEPELPDLDDLVHHRVLEPLRHDEGPDTRTILPAISLLPPDAFLAEQVQAERLLDGRPGSCGTPMPREPPWSGTTTTAGTAVRGRRAMSARMGSARPSVMNTIAYSPDATSAWRRASASAAVAAGNPVTPPAAKPARGRVVADHRDLIRGHRRSLPASRPRRCRSGARPARGAGSRGRPRACADPPVRVLRRRGPQAPVLQARGQRPATRRRERRHVATARDGGEERPDDRAADACQAATAIPQARGPRAPRGAFRRGAR